MTRPLAVVRPVATEVYCCIACAARWSYEEIRHIARCPACGGGLTRVPAGERSVAKQ